MDVFILGIERSATTWASNILNSHPATAVFMEPLSIHTSRFLQWPSRFDTIEDESKMAQYFQDEFQVLKDRSRLLLTRLSDSPLAWNIDFRLAQSVLSRLSPRASRDFVELNFNRKYDRFYYRKATVEKLVIKELRLNYNAHIIRRINPSAKVLVTIRSCAANVKSIQRHMERGRLGELRSLLGGTRDLPPPNTLIDYWVQSYDALLSTLDDYNMDYMLLYHTALLQNARFEAERMLDFLDLPMDPQVQAYLEFSNRSGEGVHNTNRDRADMLTRNEQERRELRNSIESVVDMSSVHPSIRGQL